MASAGLGPVWFDQGAQGFAKLGCGAVEQGATRYGEVGLGLVVGSFGRAGVCWGSFLARLDLIRSGSIRDWWDKVGHAKVRFGSVGYGEDLLMPRRSVSDGYAADTSVPVDRSKSQIEKLLTAHGAQGFQTGWQGPEGDDPGWDVIGFKWKNRAIRFQIARPVVKSSYRSNQSAMDQKTRQRWRILHLVIKAKLEAVQAGVSVFEEEFLAHIVTDDGQTIGQHLMPRLAGGGQLQLGSGAVGK